MVRAREPREREAGVEVDGDGDRVHVPVAPVGQRWRDAVGVRNLVRGGRPAGAAGRRRDRRAGDVARRHGEREAQPERAFVVAQRLLVLDRDDDLLAGADVGHTRREEVGPLLLDQRRLAALGLRRLVRAPGLAALVDHALDDPLADAHLQVVDGGVLRQREHVHALAPLGRRIHEPLRDADAGDHPGHAHPDVGEEERGGAASAAGVGEVQRAGAVGGRCRAGGRADDEHRERQHDADDEARDEALDDELRQSSPLAAQHCVAGDPFDVCHGGSRVPFGFKPVAGPLLPSAAPTGFAPPMERIARAQCGGGRDRSRRTSEEMWQTGGTRLLRWKLGSEL